MSNPNEPSDKSKPVVKDKDPHNYRKVGYSMIVISVSLVLIGLLVLAIGDNYHFSGDLMAKQEIDSMTPKSGYAVIVFDYTQPIGSKLKFLDSASNFETATKLKNQHTQEYLSQKGQVLIFDTSIVNNTNSISLAEVYAMTPTNGYDVVSFNTVMPVGARLSGQKLDSTLADATNDAKKYSDANTDKQTQMLTFTSSFEDNLNQILGSKYNPLLISENINHIKLMPPKLVATKPQTSVVSNTINKTNVPVQNATKVTTQMNATTMTALNMTKSSTPVSASTEKIGINSALTTQVMVNKTTTGNTTGSSVTNQGSINSTSGQSKKVSLAENVGITAK